VSVTFVADDRGQPRFAYGVGRKVGPAVVRNRVRRRLRCAAREIARDQGGLPSGAYLVTVRPGAVTLDYPELRRSLGDACLRASRPTLPDEPAKKPEKPA
jgi:ribonuclease P protein component